MAPNISNQVCPTCHQHIEDTLIPLDEDQIVMSIDDNLSFLEEQRRTFKSALKNANSIVDPRESQILQMREELTSLRSKIRTIRETLVSDGKLPSMEEIRKRVELEESTNRKKLILEQFQDRLGNFEPLSDQWFNVQKEKANLPKEDISSVDRAKLKKWNEIFMDQLIDYDFQSLATESVMISNDTYVPIHQGFDLPSNISASDFIRIIWSYLDGLLEVSRDFNTNHPGLLIFDEPRQQSAKDISFTALLRRASQAINFGQQIIFATSENKETLTKALEGVPNTLVGFEGRIIQPIN